MGPGGGGGVCAAGPLCCVQPPPRRAWPLLSLAPRPRPHTSPRLCGPSTSPSPSAAFPLFPGSPSFLGRLPASPVSWFAASFPPPHLCRRVLRPIRTPAAAFQPGIPMPSFAQGVPSARLPGPQHPPAPPVPSRVRPPGHKLGGQADPLCSGPEDGQLSGLARATSCTVPELASDFPANRPVSALCPGSALCPRPTRAPSPDTRAPGQPGRVTSVALAILSPAGDAQEAPAAWVQAFSCQTLTCLQTPLAGLPPPKWASRGPFPSRAQTSSITKPSASVAPLLGTVAEPSPAPRLPGRPRAATVCVSTGSWRPPDSEFFAGRRGPLCFALQPRPARAGTLSSCAAPAQQRCTTVLPRAQRQDRVSRRGPSLEDCVTPPVSGLGCLTHEATESAW